MDFEMHFKQIQEENKQQPCLRFVESEVHVILRQRVTL